MPRIVPSQVVSAIDSLFGPSRNELSVVGSIEIQRQASESSLLILLWQLAEIE